MQTTITVAHDWTAAVTDTGDVDDMLRPVYAISLQQIGGADQVTVMVTTPQLQQIIRDAAEDHGQSWQPWSDGGDQVPHTHGGTDAPECTPHGVECRPELVPAPDGWADKARKALANGPMEAWLQEGAACPLPDCCTERMAPAPLDVTSKPVETDAVADALTDVGVL